MKTTVRTDLPERSNAALLAVALATTGRSIPKSLSRLDRLLKGEIGRALAARDFGGARDETALFYPATGPKRVLLVGLGDRSAIDGDAVRRAAGLSGRRATELGARTLAFYLTPEASGTLGPETVARAVAEGSGQGGWTFEQLRSKRASKSDLNSVTVLASREDRRAAEQGRRVGAAVAAGQGFARDLQMRPGNLLTPSDLAGEAETLATRHGFKFTVKNKRQIEREGMNALIAVAQGSAQDPRFITIEYRGAKGTQPICLVGKGVTFDSGGISIKPALNMEEMKFDMSGAAAVLGTFEALGHLKPEIEVVGLIPATENLPSGTAVKPGDVVVTHLGKTVEVINTDAEGRLILCDALSYAARFDPACVIDLATLTGAIVIALGDQATGLMGNDPELVQQLREVGEATGERCWELPLWDAYRDQIKSDVADIKNVGGRSAGSITAGWFLKEFVAGQSWAHLDIAGTAWTDKDRPDVARGPTGVGVRLLTEFILRRAVG